MKVLFIIRELQFYERMGVMYLSFVLKQGGHSVKLLRTLNLSFEQVCKAVEDYSPEIFAYSTMTGEHRYYIELNRRLRERFPAFSVFGGPHSTFFLEMISRDGVDSVCIGEGEYALLELADKLKHKEEINDIRNMWIKRDKRIFKNTLRDLIADFDKLPFADREIMYEGNPGMRHYKTKLFFSGRGCPYGCSYCFNHRYN